MTHTCQVFCDDPHHMVTATNGVTWCWRGDWHGQPCDACDRSGGTSEEMPFSLKETIRRMGPIYVKAKEAL